jgi:hypothetical protein
LIVQAIHDLTVHEQSGFVPAFTELLPSLLKNLLALRLVLRAQACHALGGLTFGASQIPFYTHTRLKRGFPRWLLQLFPASSSSLTSSPRTPTKSDSMVVKTLRTTLAAHDPSCAAQGPVWALCTLAALVVLLGPTLVTSPKLMNTLKRLLALSVRHRKSSSARSCVLSGVPWHGRISGHPSLVSLNRTKKLAMHFKDHAVQACSFLESEGTWLTPSPPHSRWDRGLQLAIDNNQFRNFCIKQKHI